MGCPDSPTGAAGSLLYEASDSFVDIGAAAQNEISRDQLRADFFTVFSTLAVYVAEGDGALTASEKWAVSDIFWLAKNADADTYSQMIANHPDYVEKSIAYLENAVSAVGEKSPTAVEDNMVVRATEAVLQSVLAHDGSAQPEVERLSAITTRLRVAARKVAIPTAIDTAEIASILSSLDALVGLDDVKQQVETLTNIAKVFALRRRMGMAVPEMSFHLVFTGNPGTGKTTVARIIAQLYGKLGLLSKGHLTEVDRSGLVAEYIGQTAIKTQAVITAALGGVLFIDEAYSLNAGGDNDFGKEAVATLLKAMEDHRDDLVVIAAGYDDEMQQFLDINPGLRSRMPRDIGFKDYDPEEMVEIFRGMALKGDYTLDADCIDALAAIFQQMWAARGKDFANARDVRNLFERVLGAQANRIAAIAMPTPVDLRAITLSDLQAA